MIIRNSPTLILTWEDLLESVQRKFDREGKEFKVSSLTADDFNREARNKIRVHTTVIFKYFGNGTLIKFV